MTDSPNATPTPDAFFPHPILGAGAVADPDTHILALFKVWLATYTAATGKPDATVNALMDRARTVAHSLAMIPASGSLGAAVKAWLLVHHHYGYARGDGLGMVWDGDTDCQPVARSLLADILGQAPELAAAIDEARGQGAKIQRRPLPDNPGGVPAPRMTAEMAMALSDLDGLGQMLTELGGNPRETVTAEKLNALATLAETIHQRLSDQFTARALPDA